MRVRPVYLFYSPDAYNHIPPHVYL